jgi:hypothetical protein
LREYDTKDRSLDFFAGNRKIGVMNFCDPFGDSQTQAAAFNLVVSATQMVIY